MFSDPHYIIFYSYIDPKLSRNMVDSRRVVGIKDFLYKINYFWKKCN